MVVVCGYQGAVVVIYEESVSWVEHGGLRRYGSKSHGMLHYLRGSERLTSPLSMSHGAARHDFALGA